MTPYEKSLMTGGAPAPSAIKKASEAPADPNKPPSRQLTPGEVKDLSTDGLSPQLATEYVPPSAYHDLMKKSESEAQKLTGYTGEEIGKESREIGEQYKGMIGQDSVAANALAADRNAQQRQLKASQMLSGVSGGMATAQSNQIARTAGRDIANQRYNDLVAGLTRYEDFTGKTMKNLATIKGDEMATAIAAKEAGFNPYA